MKEKFTKSAHVFIALALPIAFLAGTLTSLFLKTNNPDHIDITADLAYLRPALYAGYATLVIILLLGFIASLLNLNSDRKRYAKATLITMLIVILCVVGSALAQKRVEQVEKNYSKQHVQDLFKQFYLKSPPNK